MIRLLKDTTLVVRSPYLPVLQRTVKDSAEFKETLKSVLQSNHVRKVVGGLLAHSHDVPTAKEEE